MSYGIRAFLLEKLIIKERWEEAEKTLDYGLHGMWLMPIYMSC